MPDPHQRPLVKEFRVKVTVKNNPLWRAINDTGLTRDEFAKAAGVHLNTLYGLLAMRMSPLRRREQTWTGSAKRIAERLRVMPEDLWPDAVLTATGVVRPVERELGVDDVLHFTDGAVSGLKLLPSPLDALAGAEVTQALNDALAGLTQRERAVVRWRFGFDGDSETLDQTAARFGVSKERIRQVEGRALRKLRHPSRKRKIVDALGVDPGEAR